MFDLLWLAIGGPALCGAFLLGARLNEVLHPGRDRRLALLRRELAELQLVLRNADRVTLTSLRE